MKGLLRPHWDVCRSEFSGDVMQAEDFNVIASHAVDGDVVLVQDQFSCTGDTTCSAHTRMDLKLGHRVFQLQHKAGGTTGVVFGYESSNLINGIQRRLGPLQSHRKAIDQAPYLENTAFT